MAKCTLCGKESKSEIVVHTNGGHSATICGVCALDKGLIVDANLAELIRITEDLPKGKSCQYCKDFRLQRGPKRRYYCCGRYNVPLTRHDSRSNYCECFERRRDR